MFIKEIFAVGTQVINKIEKRKQPLYYWLFSWVAIVMARMYIEDYSAGRLAVRGFFDIRNQLHEFLFYIVVFLGVVFILSFFSDEQFSKVLRSCVTFSPILLVAPIIDLTITGGKGLYMSYVYNFDIQGFLIRFLTLGGTWEGGGATPGMKIEVIFILVFIFIYLFVKTKKKFLSVIGTLYAYCGLVLIGMYPLLLEKFISLFPGADREVAKELDIKIFVLFVFALALILFFRYRKNDFKSLCQQLRFTRVIYYVVLSSMGFVLSHYINGSTKEAPIQVIDSLILIIILVLSSVFSMMINDREDVALDAISNVKRLLPSGKIKEQNYFVYGIVAFLFAIILSSTIHLEIVYLVILGNLIFFIYSAPPFSLKKIFLVSKLALAANSVIVMTLGYFLNQRECSAFLPNDVMVPLFITVFLVGHVIDVKDYEGDRKVGRKTLSTLLGLRATRYVITVMFIVSFIGVTVLLKKNVYVIYSGLLGLLTGLMLFKKPYQEYLVFFFIIISLVWFSFLYFFIN